MDGVFWYRNKLENIISYFRTVLDVLKQNPTTLNLNKCKWFQDSRKILEVYVAAGGTKSARSKNYTYDKIKKPNIWDDKYVICPKFVSSITRKTYDNIMDYIYYFDFNFKKNFQLYSILFLKQNPNRTPFIFIVSIS